MQLFSNFSRNQVNNVMFEVIFAILLQICDIPAILPIKFSLEEMGLIRSHPQVWQNILDNFITERLCNKDVIRLHYGRQPVFLELEPKQAFNQDSSTSTLELLIFALIFLLWIPQLYENAVQ